MSRKAAFDLGSNSVKMTIAESAEAGLKVIEEQAEITRIGEKLDQNGYLLDVAMDRTAAALKVMTDRCRALDVESMACVATAGMRGASNAQVFIDRVAKESQLKIEVISGEAEAGYAFSAPSGLFGPGPIVVIDLGGRSTELVAGQGQTIDARVSMEMGSVRLTERFIANDPPTAAELEALQTHSAEVLRGEAPSVSDEAVLVGVSGTILALYGVQSGEHTMKSLIANLDGAELTLDGVTAALDDYKTRSRQDRITGSIIPEGRADVIVAGMVTTQAILRHFRRAKMKATHRGVRYGVLEEMFR